jgi:voltage-gated sodium channel
MENLAVPSWRARLRAVVESKAFERTVVAIIVANALTLGLETSASAMALAGPLLLALDRAALVFFCVELAIRIVAHGPSFFRGPWNLFDFAIVAISLAPASEGFQVLRALRILRALRLLSVVPQMRRVVEALLAALPGMGSVVALLALVFYVFAVMATKLFGPSFPDWFGSIGASLYTLFQIMTLESWSMGIVRPVMEKYPQSWLFFVPFILITTFAVLNLFIALIVNAMQKVHQSEALEETIAVDHVRVMAELRAIRAELAQLRRNERHAAHGEALAAPEHAS